MIESHATPVRLLDSLVRLHGRLRSVFEAAREGSGLSNMEHIVLAAVAEARTPPTVSQIGRSLGHPRQVIQRATNSLIAKGLIASSENPDHRRASLLDATDAGRSIQAEANRRAAEVSARLMQQLDEAQLRAVIAQLEGVRAAIDAGARKAKT
ncbi:DNA-binding MarR family transcriptional regulator [Erythromicrobium ramosum]|uniref:DNA-binding MarR family transcriptional regulator n=1 Tax=Erythrobacter ramosus TaxID=35811 RepID=A0ABR6I2G9_9SPHN|nr:helix-turn-helix domain-containing protein [Erythrobacter ramosus]MBB3776950.1 DNA-binding MarR family transcriptional regulator [Erythrobacter ramosus]